MSDEDAKEEEAKKVFKDVFEEVVDLLKFVVDNSDKELTGTLPKDIDAKLTELEREVKAFCAINKSLNAKSKSASKAPQGNSLKNLSSEEKVIYERSKKVMRDAEEKMNELNAQLKAAQSKGATSNPPEDIKTLYMRFKRQKRWDKL